jgi:uncharacterized protein YndB with AHSA1/START domain
MCNHAVAMEITREITLDTEAADLWRLLADPEELAGWVGDEVRSASVHVGESGLTWTWAPDGVASTVELTVVDHGDRTTLRVTERKAGATAAARACSIGDAWDDRLLGLELRCLTRALVPI